MDVHDIHHLIQLRMQYGVNLLSLYWRWSTLIWARHLVLRRAAHVFPKLSVIVEDAAELASDGDELPLDVLHVFELQHSQWFEEAVLQSRFYRENEINLTRVERSFLRARPQRGSFARRGRRHWGTRSTCWRAPGRGRSTSLWALSSAMTASGCAPASPNRGWTGCLSQSISLYKLQSYLFEGLMNRLIGRGGVSLRESDTERIDLHSMFDHVIYVNADCLVNHDVLFVLTLYTLHPLI